MKKASIENVQASAAVHQLKELEETVFNIIEKSSELIEDSNIKNYSEKRDHFLNKLHKPEDLQEWFKSQMTISNKQYFQKGMKKIVEGLYLNFC